MFGSSFINLALTTGRKKRLDRKTPLKRKAYMGMHPGWHSGTISICFCVIVIEQWMNKLKLLYHVIGSCFSEENRKWFLPL